MSILFFSLFPTPRNLALEEELWYHFQKSSPLAQFGDKLLFILRVSNFLSLRTSALKWYGNPPDFPPSPHPSTQAVILSERSESKDLRTERS